MNILKSKKLIATALIFVMHMALMQLPLPAKERRGSTIVVTLTAGHGVVKGELLAVKADALLVYDQNAKQGKSLDLQHVFHVKVLKKTKLVEGLAIGLGVGVGILIVTGFKGPYHGASYLEMGNIWLLLPPLSSLIGGALTGITKNLPIARASSQAVQENLEQLKRYAREQE